MARHMGAEVFYDADCAFCVSAARTFERALARRRFALVPLQAEGAAGRIGVAPEHLLDEMRVRFDDGTSYGGAAAIAQIARAIWWAWPLWAVSRVPGAAGTMSSVYQWVARHRGCADGVCRVPVRRRVRALDAVPVVALPTAAFATRASMPDWLFMWLMAVSLYAGCKWLTFREAIVDGVAPGSLRAAGYLFAWPGMDASAFLGEQDHASRGEAIEWLEATFKTLLGAILVWGIARTFMPAHPIRAGWTGMLGTILLLHFGTFHLLSLVWRHFGVDAAPLMRKPLHATSVADFWGRRWNTAFHALAVRFVFRPVKTTSGVAAATLTTFVASGFIHELVISVPAHGGYGLPLGYFVLQGVAVAAERSWAGRRLGLGGGWRGRAFVTLVTAPPAFLLFAPPFIHRVILPMLARVGAI